MGGRLWPQDCGRRLPRRFRVVRNKAGSCLVLRRTGGSGRSVGRSVAREIRLARAWDRCSRAQRSIIERRVIFGARSRCRCWVGRGLGDGRWFDCLLGGSAGSSRLEAAFHSVTPILGFEGLCAAGSLLAPGVPDLAQGGWANLEKVNGRNFREVETSMSPGTGAIVRIVCDI